MITCALKGGLGNYMFQVAAAVAYGLENNKETTFNLNGAQQIHRHTSEYKTNLFRNLNDGAFRAEAIYHEPSFPYQEIPPCEKDLLLDGYFQSELYFRSHEEFIREMFSETDDIKSYINDKYEESLSSNPCSIHVRRANYTSNPHHPTQSMDYYSQAMEKMGGPFLVFSDDIAWCKDNFKGFDITFVEGEEDFIDLYLMARCRNNIIANSSFSWWAAWLNPDPHKKVIAPAMWFSGDLQGCDTSTLLPQQWDLL